MFFAVLLTFIQRSGYPGGFESSFVSSLLEFGKEVNVTNSAALHKESPVLPECCPQRGCVIVNLSQIKIVKPFCTSEGTSEGSKQVMLPITTTGNNIHLSLTFKMIYVQYCTGINVKIHTVKFTKNELRLQTVPFIFTFAICMCWFSHVTIKTRFKKCLRNVQIAVFAQ